jgi:hypothetical protein
MQTWELAAWCLVGLISSATAAGQNAQAPTADQIVEKNVAARGGVEAWRQVRTMIWGGHIATGNLSDPILPFVLEYKRPTKTRFEITTGHEKTLRIFDGSTGWKELTSAVGAPILRRFSRHELRSAREAEGIDGLLIDHQAKGIEVALEGTDDVGGHKAYRLAATLPSGLTRHVWVDAQTFLDLKSSREPHTTGGRARTESVFYRDYRAIDGLLMPMTIETRDSEGRVVRRMTIDEVTLNPSLSDSHFQKPSLPERRHSVPGIRDASVSRIGVTPPGYDDFDAR